MKAIISFDSHKHYTLARAETRVGKMISEERIEHQRGNISRYLSEYPKRTAVAIETIGSWYWIVDEIECAGMIPKLVNARRAKLMIGSINKTDKLDVKGLNMLQRTGTLPTVWIAPGDVRDKRELPRTRMMLGEYRTKIKNRVLSVLAKYGLQDIEGIRDVFTKSGRVLLEKAVDTLPENTRHVTKLLLEQLDETESKIRDIEEKMKSEFGQTGDIELLMSMPGVGFILAVVILAEIGDISRFGSAEKLAGYSGVVPRVHSSGGKTRYGALRSDSNRYLKWAYSEAGNSVAVHRNSHPERHVSVLYNRIRDSKGHSKAIGAVARHLAEATYWVLSKKENYRERNVTMVPSRQI